MSNIDRQISISHLFLLLGTKCVRVSVCIFDHHQVKLQLLHTHIYTVVLIAHDESQIVETRSLFLLQPTLPLLLLLLLSSLLLLLFLLRSCSVSHSFLFQPCSGPSCHGDWVFFFFSFSFSAVFFSFLFFSFSSVYANIVPYQQIYCSADWLLQEGT